MTKESSVFNFDHKRKSLIDYMKVKMEEGDWHGVSDAANDLRVLEAHESARQVYGVRLSDHYVEKDNKREEPIFSKHVPPYWGKRIDE